MPDDRLKDLQRQRAIALEQLAWLDREIAAQSGQTAPAPSPAWPAPVASGAAPPPAAHPEAAAEELLAKYQNDPVNVKSNVKRGCFLYFFLAFVLVGLAVLALYYHTFRK